MPLRPVRLARTAALALAGAATWAAAAPADLPSPFDATFQGSKRVLVLTAKGEARLRLQRSARHLVYTMDTRVRLGPVERRFHDCSVMRIDGARLHPLQYVHLDAGDPEKDVRSRFDWAAGQATTRLGSAGADVVQPLQGPTWDPMSLQVVLIGAAPHRAAGTEEQHTVLERGVARLHRVRFGGTHASAQGPVHEVVTRKDGSEHSIELLLSAEPVWQPLRITLEGVSFERVDSGVAPAEPSALADDPVPQCRTEVAP